MLSNPTNNLHNRQRQHRRQHSTPTAFEPVKVSNLPNIQRHGGHRRGMSLDQRRRQTPPQEMVSNTNLGYRTTQQQHILRETQQQRLARPGQGYTQFDNDENYRSPSVTPHRQSFDAACMNTSQYGGNRSQFQYAYTGPINTMINVDPIAFNGNNDFNLYSSDGILTPSAFLDFSAGFESSNGTSTGENSRRSSRRISGGIMDRVAQFESLASQSSTRPSTPPNQNARSYFPLTPADTPHQRLVKHEPMNARFMDDYDTSMEETIKPRNNQRARGIFDEMRKQAEENCMPSPPHSGTMPTISSFDSAPMPTGNFMNMSSLNLEFMKSENSFSEPQYTSTTTEISPSMSYHSSPEIQQNAFESAFTDEPNLQLREMSYAEPPCDGLPTPASPSKKSAHRRSESLCSVNMEESITETGITIDDIAGFISGPDPADGKWLCLYPECKKRFGRKENIKSHVQTHLGDRQFQCPHCKKCFVRQHDLKRHAKIHSGVKPYPCQCGNSFARHDALTRHRQRGMCIGAFEGVVKKTVKRGRPRKNRPDNEERLKKSSRTRSKNKAMSSASSASSTTGSSESGDGGSPRSEADVLDDKPFAGYEYTQPASVVGNSRFTEYHSALASECVSPQAVQALSPAAFSVHSHISRRGSIAESIHLLSHPGSPTKSIHSVHSYHSPPGLCESSSSPAPSNQYYDCDSGSQHGDGELNMNVALSNIQEHDDEMFLEAFAAESSRISALERDPELLVGKFDDSFASANTELFRNEEDVFFGSP